MSGYDEGISKERPERYGFGTRGIGRWVAVAGAVVLVAFCLMLGLCSTGRQGADSHGMRESAVRQRHAVGDDGEGRRLAPDMHGTGEPV